MSNFLDDYVEVLEERHDQLDGKKYEGEVIDINKKIISFSGVPSLEEVDDELNILQEQIANEQPQNKMEKYQLFSQMKLVRSQVEKIEIIEQKKQETYDLIAYYQDQIKNEDGDLETNKEAIEQCKQRINELNTQEKQIYIALGREELAKDLNMPEIEENEEIEQEEPEKQEENEKDEKNEIANKDIEEEQNQDNEELTNEESQENISQLNDKIANREQIETLIDYYDAQYYLLSKQGKTEQELQIYLNEKESLVEALGELDAEIDVLAGEAGDKIPEEIKGKLESRGVKEGEQQDLQNQNIPGLDEKLDKKEELENIIKYYNGLHLSNEISYKNKTISKEEFEQEQDLLEQSIEKVKESLQDINKQISDLLPKKTQPKVSFELLQKEIQGLEDLKEYYTNLMKTPEKEEEYSKYIEKFNQEIAKNKEMIEKLVQEGAIENLEEKETQQEANWEDGIEVAEIVEEMEEDIGPIIDENVSEVEVIDDGLSTQERVEESLEQYQIQQEQLEPPQNQNQIEPPQNVNQLESFQNEYQIQPQYVKGPHPRFERTETTDKQKIEKSLEKELEKARESENLKQQQPREYTEHEIVPLESNRMMQTNQRVQEENYQIMDEPEYEVLEDEEKIVGEYDKIESIDEIEAAVVIDEEQDYDMKAGQIVDLCRDTGIELEDLKQIMEVIKNVKDRENQYTANQNQQNYYDGR